MKRTAVLLAAVLTLSACASGIKVASISKNDLKKMSPTEITQFYEAENAKLKEKILYNYGGAGYEAADPILNQMNAELNALSKQKIARSGYDLKLKDTVEKYNNKIAAALESSKPVNE